MPAATRAPGTKVPTVCGLVGLRPRAQYLMLPVPPGCLLDAAQSEADPPQDPEGDGTLTNDGWALFSGTSAAAPQVAGAAALLLGAKPQLTPAQVADCLTHTAIDVTVDCHPRFSNEARPIATRPGYGRERGGSNRYANRSTGALSRGLGQPAMTAMRRSIPYSGSRGTATRPAESAYRDLLDELLQTDADWLGWRSGHGVPAPPPSRPAFCADVV
jgi:subtilisin family serine protease